jgi:hypothetical protein
VDQASPFFVPSHLHVLGDCVQRYRRLWLALGRLEAQLLAHELRGIGIIRPVFVCGLARSGSTLLHEILAAQPGVATHRVKDYPLVYTPCWWRRASAGRRPAAARERAHGDRVLITSDSPEALEEMVWMAFFPRCHDPAVSNVLGAQERHPAFEAFYRTHIRKLLLAEGASRYVAKANYHVARLAYLLRLFPDARFVVPVRDPLTHVGSLMRQHQRFAAGERRHPRALAYMRRAGHFEFGLDRRPMNLGDDERVRQVQQTWAGGEEVRGWGRYWALVHDYLAGVLGADSAVRSAALVVRYEELCDRPEDVIRAVFRHCGLAGVEQCLQAFAGRIARPDYYRNPLGPADVAVLREATAAAARRWGYE